MKKIQLFLLLVVFPAFVFATSQKQDVPVSLKWEMGSNEIEPGIFENTYYITNTSHEQLGTNWIIYFSEKQTVPINKADAPIIVERICATFYKMYPSPAYKSIAAGETLTFTYRAKGSVIKNTFAPEGAYFVTVGSDGLESAPQTIGIQAVPFTNQTQWSRAGFAERPYPSGDMEYDQNTIYTEKVTLNKTDIFPSVKDAKHGKGEFSFSKSVALNYDPTFANEGELLKERLTTIYGCTVSSSGSTKINMRKLPSTEQDGEYHISLKNGTIDISGADQKSVFYASQTLLAMLGASQLPTKMRNATISDYPDMAHRGFMLDVARNFTTKENVLKMIDILSMYKMNVLHLHLTDDEGWRIEIPGIEELTTVGSRRGHTLDESECLYPAYCGGWDADNKASSANGFYTREDFVDILNYAHKRHIKVIPEIDLPGHARAAIKSMQVRYNKYIATDKAKAEEYMLVDMEDTSTYLSAQSYTENVINVAMPSTYRFVEKVVSEMDKMYRDAGLKLDVFHLGGDEVANGAWEGSPIVSQFMKDKNIDKIRDLKDYFIAEVLKTFKRKDIQLGAWQEVALLRDGSVNERFADSNVLSYCWSTIPEWKSDEVPYSLANKGYPIILCNVTNFYFDLSYNKHESVPGAYWAGLVNEYDSFNMLPYQIYRSVHNTLKGEPVDTKKVSQEKLPLQENARGAIKGVQGQLWAETIRNFDMVQYYIFPKMYGLVERGWNSEPSWAQTYDQKAYNDAVRMYYAKISQHEMPRLTKLGINYRLPHPGIKLEDGKLYANTSVDGAEIRYTTDGSEPTRQSALWTAPVDCNATYIRSKTFYQDKESVISQIGYRLKP